MIQSFADPLTADLFHGIHSHEIHKTFSSDLVKASERKLDLLNCAESLESLGAVPSVKPEGIVRDAHGKYSIPINKEWRLTFRWKHEPEDVEIKSW